ncbi:FERM domain-containing protein 4B isoform X2 [Lissotriton helveticus]
MWYLYSANSTTKELRRCTGSKMTEGRQCQVQLLDDRKLELLVQPKLLSRELLDLVASYFNLKEKEYFGITFVDDTGQHVWLQLDHRVLDHDLPKKPGPVTLSFLVRFYIESISFLKDSTTVELFFLNTRSCVQKGQIEVESNTVFKLAALILQEAKGDYTSDEKARNDLKALPSLPTRTLQEHPSLAYCEDRVIEHYRKLKGVTRGRAIVQYMTIVEALPTYGVHYYGVKDKQGIPWWLGISYKGIGQYDLQDKVKPRKLFQWKQLENLYFREKKFAVEVHDSHRISGSRRTFGQSGLVVQTWYASNSLIKTIWVMAISQHQFYLDRKQSKAKIPSARSLDDIAMELSETGSPRGAKLVTLELKNPLIMASNGSLISSGSQDSETSDEQRKEKILELKKKEKALQEALLQKVEELKKLCLREAELTGKLPVEYPLGEDEKPPQIRRRMGTTFKLDDNMLQNEEDPTLQSLESKFRLQQKIVEAAKRLASEPDLHKNMKRKRKQDYADAMKRLQEVEAEINEYRVMCGKEPTKHTSLVLPDDIIPSESSSLSDASTFDDDNSLIIPGQKSNSPRMWRPKSLGVDREDLRRSSFSDQFIETGRGEPSSTHSSPYKTSDRQPQGRRSMPATPVLTRNAYSTNHLQPDVSPENCRPRSGSLESQTQLLSDAASDKVMFPLSSSHRSNSTEILDDGSSYTSQSSTEYYTTVATPSPYYTTQTLDNRSSNRRRYKKQNFPTANSGSMPNLAQKDSRNTAYQMTSHQPPPSFLISGYLPYTDSEPYQNGGYLYENNTEGQYSVNPSSYRASAHYGFDHYRDYRYQDEQYERVPQNPYATMRLPRKKPAKTTEQITKNINKALVAEHLRGWYNRASSQKDLCTGLPADYDSDRGSQRSLCFSPMQVPCSPSIRAPSFCSVSSSNASGSWKGPGSSRGHPEYESYSQPSYSSCYTGVYNSLPARGRQYVEPNQLDYVTSSHMGEKLLEDDPSLYWHEDSKPGTLV